MFAARAVALATTDVAFLFLPPNRPGRSERRTAKLGVTRTLVRAIRRELARAAHQPETHDWMPRLTNYPY